MCCTLNVEKPLAVMVLFKVTQAEVALANVLTIDVGTVIVCKDDKPLRACTPNEDTFFNQNSFIPRHP